MHPRPLFFAAVACALHLSSVSQSACAGQDKPQEKYGPKVEPPAMGSDYQPLLWAGSDAAFALDTVGFGTCQMETSGQAASNSSNPDIRQLASQSFDLEQHNIKKLKSMARAIQFRFPSKKNPPPCIEAGDLAQLSGANFDKSYLAYLSKVNAADVARFQVEASAPPDSANFDLRKFAAVSLPALAGQQRAIDALRSKLTAAQK